MAPLSLVHLPDQAWRRKRSQVHEDVLEREAGSAYISREAEFLAEANPGSDVTVRPVDLDKEPFDRLFRAFYRGIGVRVECDSGHDSLEVLGESGRPVEQIEPKHSPTDRVRHADLIGQRLEFFELFGKAVFDRVPHILQSTRS